MREGIVNIINFIRGIEPREPALDIVEPVRGQLSLLRSHGLPGTFLLQYDALQDRRVVEPLKAAAGDGHEIGAWLEIMKPLVEKAGIAWRGRPGFAWDWHAHVGFSVGYSPREREALVDVLMRDFRETFGRYPESVGSWIIDAHTLAYLADRYGVVASCNCKDQWGTDGYTLWGGYLSPAYYPSRKNVLAPARGEANRIPIPVFRMLGSDPIYQYDAGFLDAQDRKDGVWQPVITLEPVYPHAGGSPEWVRWFFRTVVSGPSLPFGYAQVGQENSFGWKAMRAGLEDQLELVARERSAGKLRVECLRESGRRFRERYAHTPASAVAALEDWRGQGHASIWYCSRFYRINAFQERERVWIRDMHCFDDEYPERYLSSACREPALFYDNLPVVDGSRWSEDGVRAGLYLVEIDASGETAAMCFGAPEVREESGDELLISWPILRGGACILRCTTEAASLCLVDAPLGSGWGLKLVWSVRRDPPLRGLEGDSLRYQYNGWPYRLKVDGVGSWSRSAGEIVAVAEGAGLVLRPLSCGVG